MSNLKIEKKGQQWCYTWTDELGTHQYYCEFVDTDVGTIVNYERKLVKSLNENILAFVYSWNDNLGFHQYHI